MRGRNVAGSFALLALVLAGCELAEVTTEPGQNLVVVEAVLRAGSGRQVVLLHRSLQENKARPEPGAMVTVTGRDGQPHLFTEVNVSACGDGLAPEQTDSLGMRASCYIAVGRNALVVSAGETYELRVATADGREMRGRTSVPGPFEIRGPGDGPGVDCALPPMTNLPLSWSVARGAWSYLGVIEIIRLREALAGAGIDAPDRLELTGVAISQSDTTLVIPAEIGIFELGDVDQEILLLLRDGFPAGVTVDLTLSAVDRNYVNSVRGGNFNPSGMTRISSIVGDGVGVFGSVVPRSLQIQVGSNLPYPPCL